jgi:hypothetical protein
LIDGLLSVKEDEFKAYPSVQTDLDLVHLKDQYTHLIILDSCEPVPTLTHVAEIASVWMINRDFAKC